jgi:UDP-N-acetylmuramate--alanine ligase
VAVVTNLEHDHPDCFPTFESMRDAFRQFVAKIPQDGLLVVCGDDEGARGLTGFSRAGWITYGLGDNTTWRATDLRANNVGGGDFVVVREGQTVGVARLRVPGQHNALNALAAIAATSFLGVSFEDACDALREFRGVQRRFEMRGESRGVAVIDDYGHHPTEIRATLAAARMMYPARTIWAVWQPHTFSRTRLLADRFATAFDDANHVIVTKIYASREKDAPGIDAPAVVARMRHPDARYVESLDEVVDVLAASVQPNDVVITMSAGDATQISDRLLERLKAAA